MDSSESSGSWSLLCLVGSGSVGSLWPGENASRGEKEDVAVAELLLELTGKSLLDLMEILQERDWDEDNDCALAVADFEL